MTAHVALLRAINVGGNSKVAMADLRGVFEALGFAGAQTVLQTGNVVFQSSGRSTTELEALLETETAQRLGLRTDYMVRTAAELNALIERNPFPDEAKTDPGHLVVMFLKAAPKPTALDALRAAIKGREVVEVAGKDAFVVYPDGIGRSKLTNAIIEKHLGTSSTGRNWNTVLKLAALMAV